MKNIGMIIICIIAVLIACEELGVFQAISESEQWGWVFNDMANPYMSTDQIAAFTPEQRYEWWKKVIEDPETKWAAEYFGAAYLDTIPDSLRKRIDANHEMREDVSELFTEDRGVLRLKYAEGDQRGMVVVGDQLISLTQLNEKGMQIQKENGCFGCHL